MPANVSATPAALDIIERLVHKHGPLAFFQSGGCCDGSAAICLKRDEMPPGPGDRLLGELGEAPFYIDAEQHDRWRRPQFVIDVRPGAAEGFSLEALEDVHFISRSPTRREQDGCTLEPR